MEREVASRRNKTISLEKLLFQRGYLAHLVGKESFGFKTKVLV